MKPYLLILTLLLSCGSSPCSSELLVIHHVKDFMIDPESLDFIIGELERGTGKRWKVKEDEIKEEVSDVYQAQERWGKEKGYHLTLYSPPFYQGSYWNEGMAFYLGCTPNPYRVAAATYAARNTLGSRTSILHELGHLLGAGDSTGVMSPHNNGDQYYSRESVLEMRACKAGDICH